MDFRSSKIVSFPLANDCLLEPPNGTVYVFFWMADRLEHPFYVGQTQRFLGRMHDFKLANYDAPRDFQVGEAVKYLIEEKGYDVIVKHRPSKTPRDNEREIIRNLVLEGRWLLNFLPAYKYQKRDEEYRKCDEIRQRDAVQKFCDLLIASHVKR